METQRTAVASSMQDENPAAMLIFVPSLLIVDFGGRAFGRSSSLVFGGPSDLLLMRT
jgi:hypothetical protein